MMRRMLAGTGRLGRRQFGAVVLSALTQGQTTPEGKRPGEERVVSGVRLCWCPAGRFQMGSPANEPDRRADEGPVEVRLSSGFWMGKHEATQGQWTRTVGAFPHVMDFGAGDDFPMYWVNYAEAVGFCRQLTERAWAAGELDSGWAFQLPTEAQWEYACRAGTSTATAFGPRFQLSQANIAGEPDSGGAAPQSLGRACAVGSYAANAWGIHDMHGNVFEWCRDWYHAQLPGGADPDLSHVQGTPNRDGTYSRVRRGGAWNDPVKFCRSAFRLRYEPERRSDHIGFRVAVVRVS